MQSTYSLDLQRARDLVGAFLDQISAELQLSINKPIHDRPETCYEEFFACETISSYLESKGFHVTRKAYGLDTSFEASIGESGRQVVFCAEYDALPGIGHACGHNLIATSSIAAFLSTAHVLQTLNIAARLRLLGTPAEEGGGGKAKLIHAGAFDPPEDIAAAIMAHPVTRVVEPDGASYAGLAGGKSSASHKFKVEFHGKTAHAAGSPWDGINALDAAVSAYNNVALLRQQIRRDERIHAIIEVGGTVQNVITSYARMSWNVRAPTLKAADVLLERVKACINAGALATQCTTTYLPLPTSANLRANEMLSRVYVEDMARFGRNILALREQPSNASTDMGNVSHHVPSFHGRFSINAPPGVTIHNPAFTALARTDEAHRECIMAAKGMAMLALRVLTDSKVSDGARNDFETKD